MDVGTRKNVVAMADVTHNGKWRRLLPIGDEKPIAVFFTWVVRHILKRNHARVFWGDRLLSLDKNMAFLDDPAFLAAYQAVRGSHVYDLYDSPHTISWRLNTLVWAARQAAPLPGDFVECGVFKGDMAWVVARVLGVERMQRQFYLYDTFAGFSEKYSSPADFPDFPEMYNHVQRAYAVAGLYEQVRERFAPMPNVKVIRGVVPDVFAAQPTPQTIAYLHIDLNSAAAEVGALDALFDRVVPGGVIVLDDYGWYHYRKQTVAEDAFMAARGYRILELPTGQGLVIKRPAEIKNG